MVEIIFGDINNQPEEEEKTLDIINGGMVNVNKAINMNGYKERKLENSSALKDVFENLDRDEMDADNLTTIDFNTRLRDDEIGDIVSLQMMTVLKVGGDECSLIARTIKRHKVSLGGEGRKEKVRIAQGEREQETSNKDTSLFGKIKGFIGGKNDQNQI